MCWRYPPIWYLRGNNAFKFKLGCLRSVGVHVSDEDRCSAFRRDQGGRENHLSIVRLLTTRNAGLIRRFFCSKRSQRTNISGGSHLPALSCGTLVANSYEIGGDEGVRYISIARVAGRLGLGFSPHPKRAQRLRVCEPPLGNRFAGT